MLIKVTTHCFQIKSITGPKDTQHSNQTFSVSVKTDAVALFVWLETDRPGMFSDNGFVMTQEEAELSFYAAEEMTVEDLQSSLTVKSLTDTYQQGYVRETYVEDLDFHPNDIRNVIFT